MTWPLAMALGLAACGDGVETLSLDTNLSGIIRGRPATETHHDAVVGIHERLGQRVSSGPFCSGTLVKPNVIITAAHCLDDDSSGATPVARAADTVAVYFGAGVADDTNPIFVGATETRIFSGYDRSSVLGDIAMIRLSQPVPATLAAPIPALPPEDKLEASDVGGALEFVGFGISESGSGIRLTTTGRIDQLGDTQLAYGQRNGGPCSGDSGGPAFIQRPNGRFLVGVTSYGDANCRYYGVSTRTDAYGSFVKGL